ncbi:cell division protein ZapE [Rhodococcus sp. BE178]|uniref:cell division protein ZapE n=1 Tax=Rhodococcus sp. BE178 TaxID=2817737 RepID=UPI003D1C66B9
MRWFRRAPLPALHVPAAVFETAAADRGFALDHAQRQAISDLIAADGRSVYLWGPVGRGKSWLLNTYFDGLPTEHKLRVHFHEFFRDLHVAIRRRGHNLDAALDDLLRDVRVLCFDEFHVHDVGDATFVARLLPALLARDVTLVVTSNYPPHRLMPNPLFHDAFVPTIELIERSLAVVAVDGPRDYRTGSDHAAGFAAGHWVVPADAEQLALLGLERPDPTERRTMSPCGHPLVALRADAHCLWFDFADLCGHTTAPADYLELTARHERWVISDIPDLVNAGSEPAQRFANLVDVLYDRDVEVTFLAARTVDSLAGAEHLPVDIDRILSRLGQLQTLPTETAPAAAGAKAPSTAGTTTESVSWE